MSSDRLSSLASRICFIAALIFVALAGIEVLANFFGYTVLRGFYTGGRLLEFAAILVIFVIALLLRQIRQELRARKP